MDTCVGAVPSVRPEGHGTSVLRKGHEELGCACIFGEGAEMRAGEPQDASENGHRPGDRRFREGTMTRRCTLVFRLGKTTTLPLLDSYR